MRPACHVTKAFLFAAEVFAILSARGFAIGICTNKPEKLARLVLQRLALDLYVFALVASDSGYGKNAIQNLFWRAPGSLRFRRLA